MAVPGWALRVRSGALDSEFNTSAAAIRKCLCDETAHSCREYLFNLALSKG